MALGNGNPTNGNKGSNFNYERKVLQGLNSIATTLVAAGDSLPSPCAPGSGVCQLVAGDNITLSPETGLGTVTINAAISDLSGTDYIVVLAKGTPEENAAEFLAAYDLAVAADKTYDNHFSLVLAPGHYRFAETFQHNEAYIDITSLTGQQDVIFDLELNGQDPFTLGLPAYIYNLGIEADTVYYDSLQNGQPSFLSVNGSVSQPSHGFDSSGMYFSGEASGYPVYTNFLIPGNQITTVTFNFVHSYDCTDQGVCVYLDEDTPQWQWGTNSTRIAAQYNCPNPNIYGVSNTTSSPFSLTIGETYIAQFTYDPIDGICTLETKDLSGTVLDALVLNEVLIGDYRIAFSADSGGADEGDVYNTSPVMRVNASNVTISNIKTVYYSSNNFWNWTESDPSYNLPIATSLNSGQEGLVFKNCAAGPFSFGANTEDNAINTEITCIDCVAEQGYSFGFGMFYDYGSYTNCISYGLFSWLPQYLAGEYINCTSAQNSFVGSTASVGYFVGCSAGENSFTAPNGQLGGYFKDCKAEDYSFTAATFNQGDYINCEAGVNSFTGDIQLSGSFTDCKAGSDSFRAGAGTIYSSFIRCTTSGSSFYAGVANNGSYYYCILFAGIYTGGNQYYCIPD